MIITKLYNKCLIFKYDKKIPSYFSVTGASDNSHRINLIRLHNVRSQL